MVSKSEVKEKRKSLFSNSERRHTFNKGDKRVHTPRLCVVCGRPLSSLVMNEQKYVTIQSHIHFHINKDLTVDTCSEIHSCYTTLKQKGELKDVDDK